MVHGLAMDDFIRVTRVLTYEGPRGEVEEQLSRSMGDGHQRRSGKLVISATTIGNFPQVITSGAILEKAMEEGRRQGLQEAQSIPRYLPFPSLSGEKLDPGVGWNPPEHPLEGVASVAKRLEEARLKEAWNKEEGK